MKKMICYALAACLLLSGCGVISDSNSTGTKVPTSVLDLSELSESGRMDTYAIYFLNSSNNTLTAEPRKLNIKQDTNPAITAVEALLAGPSNDSVAGVAKIGMTLDYIEFSNEAANVYINYYGGLMQSEEAYILEQAIANTVTDILGDTSICVFYNGIRRGFDGYPAAPLKKQVGNVHDAYTNAYAKYVPQQLNMNNGPEEAKPTDEQTVLPSIGSTPTGHTTQNSLMQNEPAVAEIPTVLYFVAASGDYILPEVRTVKYVPGHFEGEEYVDGNYIEAVIEELRKGPQNTAVLESPLLSESKLTTSPLKIANGSAAYDLSLMFSDLPSGTGKEALLSYAAIIYSITGLVPGIEDVNLYVRGTQVTGGSAGGSKRNDYFGCLGSSAPVYFEDENSDLLLEVSRSMEQGQIWSARARLLELMRGPQKGDSESVEAVMPTGSSEADILAVNVDNDTAYINLSENFKNACKGLSERSEMLLVFAMVNTVTALDGISKVQFLVEGKQVDTLAGHLCLSDPFLKNYGIIKNGG